MTTTILTYSRADEIGEVTIGAGSAVTGEVEITYEDALTREEVITALEAAKLRLLSAPFPRA